MKSDHAQVEAATPALPPALDAWSRRGIWLLPVWGLLLALSTITHQPDYDTDFAGYADYVTTPVFLVSHLGASILGAAVGIIALSSVAVLAAADGDRPGRSLLGGGLSVVGNVLNTAIYGVAAFFQPAIGRAFHSGVDGAARPRRDSRATAA